jgi:hypothetical protein
MGCRVLGKDNDASSEQKTEQCSYCSVKIETSWVLALSGGLLFDLEQSDLIGLDHEIQTVFNAELAVYGT